MDPSVRSQPNPDAGVPELQDGLYRAEGEECRLIGNRCLTCVRVFFPKRARCARCSTPDLAEVSLSRTGRIGAFSLIDRQPADAWIRAPYIQAEIEMPEGVSVFTVLDAPSLEAVDFGMEAELAFMTVEGPQGAFTAYVFRPLETQE